MKKVLSVILMLAIGSSAFSQPTTETAPAVQTDYLKKSKNQNTLAWILLGGGLGLTSAGIAVGLNEAVNDISNIFSGEEQKSSSAGAILFYTGLASMLTSVPLFIVSSSNKRKAEEVSVSLKMEKFTGFHQQSLVQKAYPSISLKIKL